MTITRELIEKFKHYLIEEEKSSATLEKYMRDVTVFFAWLAGSELDKIAVLRYKEHLTLNYAPASVNSVLSSLNSFFEYNEWHCLKVKMLKIYEYINGIVNRLIDNIELANAEVKNQSRSDEYIDELTNEIYIKTINDNTEKDEILKDIYTLARLKFKSYTKTDMSKVTEKIKQELCKYGINEKAPLPLMEKIISKFYIGGEKGLQIKLINEKILEREG